ncbi:hypothetical protein B0T25DRAFT_513354 [Lasiosphaeria hispida]|uniref:Uncharacterized protein n=1 Tax=Lasiosphaeria hispida TaxID=260671 RepID=A0AAJ0HUU2_9PEZI|nr:hypothetical protein B0T25DRAFT_513354 [Lasiosphaeria hispida]
MAPQIPGASVPATLLTEHPTVSSPAITCPSVEPYGFSLRSHKARTRIKDRVLGSLEPERTRAFRAYHREVGTKGRLREREEKERIESATRDLEDLNADLIAQEKALTEEKLALKEELFRHAAYCNDSAISDYLTYTAKEIVEKAKTQYYKDRPCCCQR